MDISDLIILNKRFSIVNFIFDYKVMVMVMKREREIVYYYRWDPHEHILSGDDKAQTGLHVAAT